MSEKYIDNIVDDIYGIITKRGNWPYSFNVDNKIKLLETIQAFYVKKDTRDGYARCAKIQSMVEILKLYDQVLTRKMHVKPSGSTDVSKN